MGRKRKNEHITGQIEFLMPSLDSRNYVVESNDLIFGRQHLSLNAAKLLRTCIMQIKPGDSELKPYIITVGELEKLLGIPSKDIYRDIEGICDNILKNPVYVKSRDGRRWAKYPWVSLVQYDSGIGVSIQLNDVLRPFLLELKAHYTQYALENVLVMKSVYSLRLFEMITARVATQYVPHEGVTVTLTLQEIRDGCGIPDDVYKQVGHFISRVIKPAETEIQKKTSLRLEREFLKEGRRIVAVRYNVNRWWNRCVPANSGGKDK